MKRGLITLFLLMIILPFVSSSACVEVVVSDISPSSVGIGEKFSVGITLDSCGADPAKGIIFELYDISEDISIKEPLRKDIGDMGYANSDRFITYHMETSDDAKPGTYVFRYSLDYKSGGLPISDSGSFSVTVNGDEAKLNIASSKTDPVLPIQGDTTEITIRIENFGDGDANSISIYADHPFKGIKQSFLGTLEAGEDGPAVFTFIVTEPGDYVIPITISYQDDFGNHEIEKEVKLTIIESDDEWKAILALFIGVLIIVLILINHFRVKKKKDRIIQQLLKDNGKSSEKKHKRLRKK